MKRISNIYYKINDINIIIMMYSNIKVKIKNKE